MHEMQPEMTEALKTNHLHSILRKETLQTFRDNTANKKRTLEDVLFIFQRKYTRPQS